MTNASTKAKLSRVVTERVAVMLLLRLTLMAY